MTVRLTEDDTQHLHDAVCEVDASLLQEWADDHLCQLEALARILLEALEHSPYALTLLAKLGRLPFARGAGREGGEGGEKRTGNRLTDQSQPTPDQSGQSCYTRNPRSLITC